MWGNDDSFDARGGKKGGGGGGFVNSPGVDQGGDKSRGKRSQNIVPVTVRQILDSADENIKIEDQEASVVTIVGLVTQVEQTTVKVSFTIDDQTGSIEALKYIGENEGGAKQVILMAGTYARIVGVVRNQKGQAGRYIVMYKAMPVLDMNEVTCHILEVCQVPIKLKKLQEQEASKIGFGGAQMNQSSVPSMMGTSLGGGTNNSFGNSNAGGMPGLTTTQNMVFRAIQSVPGEEGVHIDTIVQNLKNKLSPKDIKDTIEFLSGEGHVYSTKDDDHFKTTDW